MRIDYDSPDYFRNAEIVREYDDSEDTNLFDVGWKEILYYIIYNVLEVFKR